MNSSSSYIMRDQVRDLIPGIMAYDATYHRRWNRRKPYLLAILFISFAYILSSTL